MFVAVVVVQKAVSASFASMFEREVVRRMASKRRVVGAPVVRKSTPTFNRYDTTGVYYGGDDLDEQVV